MALSPITTGGGEQRAVLRPRRPEALFRLLDEELQQGPVPAAERSQRALRHRHGRAQQGGLPHPRGGVEGSGGRVRGR